MKYNLLWDVLFKTGLFDTDLIESEFSSYLSRRMNRYGIPLDNRAGLHQVRLAHVVRFHSE